MNKLTNNQLIDQRLQVGNRSELPRSVLKVQIVSLGTCWICILQWAIYLNSPQSCFSCDSPKLPLSNRKKCKKTAGLEKITLSIIIIIIIIIITIIIIIIIIIIVIIIIIIIIMIFLRWSEDKASA